MCSRCFAGRYQKALLAVASTTSPTGSPKSSVKPASSQHPENGQRLAANADHPPRSSSFASQNAACGPRQTHVRNAGLLETDRLAAEMLNRLRQEDNYGDDFPGRQTRIKRRSLPHLASLAYN